jgi:hypothetical protein
VLLTSKVTEIPKPLVLVLTPKQQAELEMMSCIGDIVRRAKTQGVGLGICMPTPSMTRGDRLSYVGVPFAERGKRVVEMVQLMRALWTGETVDFQG